MRPEPWLQNFPHSLPSARRPAWLRAAPSFAVPSRGKGVPGGGPRDCGASPHRAAGCWRRAHGGPLRRVASAPLLQGFSQLLLRPSGSNLSRTPRHRRVLPAAAPGTQPGTPAEPRGARTCPGALTRDALTKHPARRSHPRRISTRPHPRDPGRESSASTARDRTTAESSAPEVPPPPSPRAGEHPLLGSHWPGTA